MDIITLERYSVLERVPHNRRSILVWGYTTCSFGGYIPSKTTLLGITRFNPTKEGGDFDICKRHYLNPYITTVTHWSELI